MYSTILHKRNSTSGSTPVPDSLSAGEIAVNVADGKLFTKLDDGSIATFLNSNQAPYVLNNSLSSDYFLYGGNTVTGVFAGVLGGYNNDVSGSGSTTVNGEDNDIAGDFAFIGSGLKNKITASGDYSAILGGQNNLISHQNSFTIGSNLSSHAENFTYVNNISGVIWGDGSNLQNLNASNITSGTLGAARLPAFEGDITTAVGSASATVVKLQGNPISVQLPSNGQILQWNGTAWTPGALPSGGSGGGGLSYYFNFGTEAQTPTTNLSATPNTPRELGVVGVVSGSSYTSGNISQTDYDLICGFVSLTGNPGTTTIPAGLWDFNIWASSTASSANQMAMRIFVYKYDGVNIPTLLSQSDDINIYDPVVSAQYIASVVFPQTTILTTDRIYIEIRAKASQNNKTITLYFGGATPSHVHTTLPSVGGSGLVKVINGVYQNPASLLVDSDVAPTAAIDQTKINGLVDTTNKTNSVFTTVQSNSSSWGMGGGGSTVDLGLRSLSANWQSTYSTVSSLSSNWNYQGADLKALSANWDSVYSNVQTNSASYATTSFINGNFIPLSGGTITGSLSVIGNITYLDTAVQVTSAMFVDTNSSETALRITQRGTGDVIRVEDEANPDSTPFIINADGLVGVGTSTPSEKLTVSGGISATGIISASASNVRINVINSSANRTFTDADNNRVVHIDTTTSSLCAIFPNSLSNGFNVAIMNTGTNSLIISAANLNSAGTTITTRFGGAFIYKDSNNLFAVGRLV